MRWMYWTPDGHDAGLTPQTGGNYRPEKICPYCDKIFDGSEDSATEELEKHLFSAHPVARPVLCICGHELDRDSIRRTALNQDEIDVSLTNRCMVQVDGTKWRELSVTEFKKEFTAARDLTWHIRLFNDVPTDGSSSYRDYKVRFQIADCRVLDQIDQDFRQTLARDGIRDQDVGAFQSRLSPGTAEYDYGAALGDYTLSVLYKDWRHNPRSQIEFDEFVTKMKSSLNVLKDFNRTVAAATVGAIRFNLNDFRDLNTAPLIQIGLQFFHDMLSSGNVKRNPSRVSEGSSVEICPIDEVSHELLMACNQLTLEVGGLPTPKYARLRDIAEGRPQISQYDRNKAHALCAESCLRSGYRDQAFHHLQKLFFVPDMKNWAQSQLNSHY